MTDETAVAEPGVVEGEPTPEDEPEGDEEDTTEDTDTTGATIAPTEDEPTEPALPAG